MTESADSALEQGRNQPVLSVGEFAADVRGLLEQHYPLVWIRGEISNLRQPGSGHWYFTLKDADAQLRCAMFRGRNRLLRFAPEDGLEVVVRGQVGLYAERGDFQLVVESMRPAGDGALRLAMEQLRARLQAEGLIDPARRRPLPGLPLHIALVTSPTGAALQDMLAVLGRRYRVARITLVPALVQGDDAPASICQALEQAAAQAPEIVVVARGGGSIEDLQAFNSEAVARAIAMMPIPTVSAVGHETDVTIADLVADLRAPTPSAAMELIVPDQRALEAGMGRIAEDLSAAINQRLRIAATELSALRRRVRAQAPRGTQFAQSLRTATVRLRASVERAFEVRRTRLAKLVLRHPQQRLQQMNERLQGLERRLRRTIEEELRNRRSAAAASARNLQALSPLATLDRGYAIVTTTPDEHDRIQAVADANEVATGQTLDVRLARGQLRVSVTNRQPEDP